ncbi:MAG: hypothetical protein J6328_07455 [Bacilli bacterium]|nr:hypothetical protein [Bacilli bacterium]
MKQTFKARLKKRIAPLSIYASLFSLAACGTAYLLPSTPAQTVIIPSEDDANNGTTLTDEARFLSKFINQATGSGLSAQLNLEVEFPDKDGNDETNNSIKLNTDDLFVYLKSDENSKMTFNMALNAMIDYNGYGIALGVNYTDTSLYLSLGNKMQKSDGTLPSDPHTADMSPAGAIDLKYRISDVDDIDELSSTIADVLASVERDFGSLDLISRFLSTPALEENGAEDGEEGKEEGGLGLD